MPYRPIFTNVMNISIKSEKFDYNFATTFGTYIFIHLFLYLIHSRTAMRAKVCLTVLIPPGDHS